MNNNFLLNINNVNEEVTLKGWVKKSRRLGDLVFIDLRNGTELVQIVVESSSSVYEIANSLRNEFVISVTGKVIERKNKNPNMKSGDIEIVANDIQIINKSIQTPMIIDDETDALELKRLEYRYLDLRRTINQEMLKFRSDLNRFTREYLYNNNFIEVETPVITKPTPGGAGELKVLSQNHKGKYYSLVQSPQVYKQLLMYGGVSKYFQIARCFRDEDSRADRQLEFTQLDMEMSFINESDIMSLIENMIKGIVKEFRNHDVDSIEVMKYEKAMSLYGSDKPDTRFENTISDLTELLRNTEINFISSALEQGKLVKAVYFEGDLSNSDIKKFEEEIKSQGASGLAWLKFNNGEISGSLKALSEDEINNIKTTMNINNDGVVLMILDEEHEALTLIGRVRLMVAKKLNLIDEDKLNFLWVTEFPLFELNSDKTGLESAHNPFTSVLPEDREQFLSLSNDDVIGLSKIRSRAYDLVLNGSEIGGGSIRISEYEMQSKIFDLIGISEEEKEAKFGWFIEAQKYGIPEHGGIALGLDRLISILLKKESIRDVIAFPKTTSGTDEMMKAPIDLEE